MEIETLQINESGMKLLQMDQKKKQETNYELGQGHPTSIFGKYLFGGQFEI